MHLSPEDHEALTALARAGSLRIGHGADCILRSVAQKLHLSGCAEHLAMDGRQHLAITPKGRALALRTAT